MQFFSEHILSHYNYWVSTILMMVGFYIVIHSGNLVKKLIGMAVFQTSVLLFYISAGNVKGAKVPILVQNEYFYVNPLPHVLMLTAIVVGVATLAVGLAIVVRIREAYGSIEESDILAEDARMVKQLYETSKSKLANTPAKGEKAIKAATKKVAKKKTSSARTKAASTKKPVKRSKKTSQGKQS